MERENCSSSQIVITVPKLTSIKTNMKNHNKSFALEWSALNNVCVWGGGGFKGYVSRPKLLQWLKN